MYLFAFLLAQDQREADGMQWFNYILERMKKNAESHCELIWISPGSWACAVKLVSCSLTPTLVVFLPLFICVTIVCVLLNVIIIILMHVQSFFWLQRLHFNTVTWFSVFISVFCNPLTHLFLKPWWSPGYCECDERMPFWGFQLIYFDFSALLIFLLMWSGCRFNSCRFKRSPLKLYQFPREGNPLVFLLRTPWPWGGTSMSQESVEFGRFA